jgi:hypothetical protein
MADITNARSKKLAIGEIIIKKVMQASIMNHFQLPSRGLIMLTLALTLDCVVPNLLKLTLPMIIRSKVVFRFACTFGLVLLVTHAIATGIIIYRISNPIYPTRVNP